MKDLEQGKAMDKNCGLFKHKNFTADVQEVKHGKWIQQERNIEKMKEFHAMGIGLNMAETSMVV